MGGSSKGPSQTGSATSTTTNKTADTLLPYTTYGLDSGKDIFQQNRDGSGNALIGNDYSNQGYKDLYTVAQNGLDTTNKANNTLSSALSGDYGVTNSPSYGSLYDSSNGYSSSQQAQDKSANGLYSLAYTDNPAADTATSALSKSANGDYLTSNPYIDKVYDTSAKAITDKYSTATAPDTDSTYETAGRYGSGSALNAKGQNELNLGYALDKLSADTYGTNYSNERKLQNTAATDLGTLGLNQQKLQGSLLDSAATQYGNIQTGKTTAANDLQSGYNTGNQNTLYGLSLYPSTQKQAYYAPSEETTAGQGLLSQPYYNTKQYLGLLPSGYGSSSSKTDPIYGPSALSTGTSLLGSGTSLYNTLGGSSGSGKGGASAALNGDFGGGGAAAGVADTVANAWAPSAGKGFADLLPIAAAAA